MVIYRVFTFICISLRCIKVSGFPGVFVWRRGVFKYKVWMFGGVSVPGHVLVYLGICVCVWKYFSGWTSLFWDMFGCTSVHLDIFPYGWMYLRWWDTCGYIWICVGICGHRPLYIYIYIERDIHVFWIIKLERIYVYIGIYITLNLHIYKYMETAIYI